jgi:uncharacterized protein
VDAVETRKGQTALMWAAAEGHAPVVEALVQAGANVKAASLAGFTPLVFAALKDDAKSVRTLIAAGADAKYALPSGTQALMVAAAYKSMTAATALAEAGADPNIADAAGNTPLHLAADAGNLELVRTLLARGANANARTTNVPAVRGGGGGARRVVGELTPLHVAAKPGNEAVLRALAGAGADPLLKAQGDTTLLMSAAASGSAAIVKLVFQELDRRVDAVSDTGSTVLHAALVGTLATSTADEIYESVRFLAENGAPLDAKDATGRTPLQIASRQQPLEKVVRLLTEMIARSKATPRP